MAVDVAYKTYKKYPRMVTENDIQKTIGKRRHDKSSSDRIPTIPGPNYIQERYRNPTQIRNGPRFMKVLNTVLQREKIT